MLAGELDRGRYWAQRAWRTCARVLERKARRFVRFHLRTTKGNRAGIQVDSGTPCDRSIAHLVAIDASILACLSLASFSTDPIVHLTIDPSRSVLYALTKYSNIELYSIGSDGQSLTKIARATDVCRTALMLAPDAHAMLQSNGFTIMSVSAIGTGEGDGGAQMVAVTGRGSLIVSFVL